MMITKKITTRLLSLLGFAALLAPMALEREAHADTDQICMFTSENINYSDGYHRDHFSFSWNNTTGAVLSSDWHFPWAAGIQQYNSASTIGTMTPGYDPSGTTFSRKAFELNFTLPGAPGVVYVHRGEITSRATPNDTTFVSTYQGTNTAWAGGYGTVTCN